MAWDRIKSSRSEFRMDVGDLAVEKKLLSASRLGEIREELKRASNKGMQVPEMGEILVSRGFLNEDTLNALEEEVFLLTYADSTPVEGEAPRDYPGRFAHYKVEGMLGEGGSGTVFRAVDQRSGKEVAVKILPERLARNERYVRRFLREARTAAKLHHRNIVEVYEVGRLGGRYFISMEIVEGKDLERRIRDGGPMPCREALGIIIQVAEALQAAHEAGIVHRDIKPANILMAGDGTVKLSDLGLAKNIEAEDSGTATGEGVALGTPCYMSPEQARDAKNADTRSDIYSLGATFYHLVTGRPPHTGANPIEILMKAEAEDPATPVEVSPAIPAAYSRVIMKMIRRSPGERFRTPKELLKALRRIEKGGIRGRLAGIDLATLTSGRANIIAWGLLGVASVLVIAMTYSLMDMQNDTQGDVGGVTVAPPGGDVPGKAGGRAQVSGTGSVLGTDPAIPVLQGESKEEADERRAAEILARISAMPRNTPIQMTLVRDHLGSLISRFPETGAAEQARQEIGIMDGLVREMRGRQIRRMGGVIEALAACYRWERMSQVVATRMGEWQEGANPLVDRAVELDDVRPMQIAELGRRIERMLRVGLIAEAEEEVQYLNQYWESTRDRAKIVMLFDRIEEAKDLEKKRERDKVAAAAVMGRARGYAERLDFEALAEEAGREQDKTIGRMLEETASECRGALVNIGQVLGLGGRDYKVKGISGAVAGMNAEGVILSMGDGRGFKSWKEMSRAQRREVFTMLAANGVTDAQVILRAWEVTGETWGGGARAEDAIGRLASYLAGMRGEERLSRVKEAFTGGKYVDARDELAAAASVSSPGDATAERIGDWGDLIRDALESTAVLPVRTRYRPSRVISTQWPPECGGRGGEAWLEVPVCPFIRLVPGKEGVDMEVSRLEEGMNPGEGGGELVLSITTGDDGKAVVKGVDEDGKPFVLEQPEAVEVVVWGDEILVKGRGGETRATFATGRRLGLRGAGGRGSGAELTALADAGYIEDRLIAGRRAASEVLGSGAQEAARKIGKEHPEAFPEWFRASISYAKDLAGEEKPVAGVQILNGIAPFARGMEKAVVEKAVEEIALSP